MKLFAPAKINLGLRVLGRRADGYHLLESVFLPLEWGDDVEVELLGPEEPALRFELAGNPSGDIPTDADNLAGRAALAFRQAAGPGPSIRVRLEKRLPSQAGLGGGSSDAGAVLRGLSELEPGRVSATQLHEVALALGADVPFFLDPRPALVSGIGERIEPLDGIRAVTVLLARGGPGLSTPRVFAAHDEASLTPGRPDPTIRPLWALRESGGLGRAGPQLRDLVQNDLEPSATRLNPMVADLQKEIEENGAKVSAMSGSGPTVYGLFEDDQEAEAAAEKVRNNCGAETRVTRTLPSSDLG